MVFRMVADILFDADSIDEAFIELAYHFISLVSGRDSDIFSLGSIEVKPKDSYKEVVQ